MSARFGEPVAVTIPGHPFTFTATVERGDRGPILTELTIASPDGITTPDVRAIPARTITTMAARKIRDSTVEYAAPAAYVAVQGKHLTDSHYRMVAEVITHAVEYGLPARKTLAERTGAPVATVTRWIKTAKELGYLADDAIPRRKEVKP